MRSKALRLIPALMALMLSMGALRFPAAMAAMGEDSVRPTLKAWVECNVLYVDARDGESGIDAITIGEYRFTGMDGVFGIRLDEGNPYTKTVRIYAADRAGNQSDVVQVSNPLYSPVATKSPSAQTPKTTNPPAAKPTKKPATQAPGTVAPSPEPTNTPTESPPEPSLPPMNTESAIPTPEFTPVPPEPTPTAPPQANPFTPEGSASVVDNPTSSDGKEFFTVVTPEGNEFFLVVDRQRERDGVYLLNAVTENDLLALAKKGDGKAVSAIPTPVPTDQPEETPEPEATTPPTEEPDSAKSGNLPVILLVVAALVAGGVGYYFKVVKAKRPLPLPVGNDEELDDVPEEGAYDALDYPEDSEDDDEDDEKDDERGEM